MRRRRTVVSALIASLLAGIVALEVSPAPLEATALAKWEAVGGGLTPANANSRVFQLIAANDGTLYAGGTFTGRLARLATTQGATWSNITAAPNGPIYSLGLTGNDLFVGGDFFDLSVNANNAFGKINTTTDTWTGLGDEDLAADDGVERLAAKGATEVYLGGSFNTGPVAGNNDWGFVEYTGAGFATVAGGISSGQVNALTLAGNTLYVGGKFPTVDVGGTPIDARGIAAFDTSNNTWSRLGGAEAGLTDLSNLGGVVAAIATHGANVYIGGGFASVQNSNANVVASTRALARWNGTAWESIGAVGGSSPVVEELRVIGDYLYVGGLFSSIGGVSAQNIARYELSTSTWEALTVGCANGVNGVVRSILPTSDPSAQGYDGSIYVAGGFTDAGGTAAADLVGKFTPGDSGGCGGSVLLSSPTDFKIARVDDAKKKVAGAWGLYVTLAWQSSGPLPPLYFKVTVDRAEDTVKGAGTSWSVISSHPEMDCWTTQLSCTIFMPYSFYGGFGLSEAKFTLYGYSFNGSSTPLSIDPPDPDAPTIPPGAPTNVVATAMERAVRVTWTKPADQGTYPITNYLVRATPSGRVCISRMTDPVLEACTFTGLTPGVNYTFKVQGLNGAGWGQYSSVSNAAASVALEITKSSRNRRTFLRINLGSTVTFDGVAPGTPANTPISVWAQWIDSSGRPVSNWEPQPGVRTNSSGKFSFRANFPRARNGQRMIVKVQTAGTCFTSGKYQPCVYQSQEVTLRSV
jgi:hypothetical protein